MTGHSYRSDPRQLDLIEWLEILDREDAVEVREMMNAKDQGSEASRVDQNARVSDLRGTVAGASPDDQSAFSHGTEEWR